MHEIERGARYTRVECGVFTDLAEAAEPELVGPAQVESLAGLEREHDNVRAVLAWATGESVPEDVHNLGLRLAAAMAMPWYIRGYWREGQQWLETTLAERAKAPAPERAKALNGASWLAWNLGDYERTNALSQEALALSRTSRRLLEYRLVGRTAQSRALDARAL